MHKNNYSLLRADNLAINYNLPEPEPQDPRMPQQSSEYIFHENNTGDDLPRKGLRHYWTPFLTFNPTAIVMSNNNFNRGRGAPRGRGQSGGNRRAARDAERAYNHHNNRRMLEDWAYEPEPYDPRREQNRKPTARSQAFKEAKAPPKKTEPSAQVVPSTSEDTPRDEPLYDIGPHSSLIPELDRYCQNFDYGGFIPIVNQTYDQLRGVDPRLAERLPLSMFTHAMSLHLNLDLVLNQRTDVREILPDLQYIPQPIVDYLSHVSSCITQDGKEIVMNLPEIAVPQGPVFQDGVEIAPSGSFGAINAQNHNVYEAYICPLVTSNRVIASAINDPEYQPLPDGLVHGNLVPNRNLLGFDLIDAQNNGAHSRLAGIVFPNDDTIEGRFRYSPLLQTRVYTVLAEMKDRFKMVEIKREQNPTGLNIIPKIPKKITAANLTFVESVGPVNDAQIPLYERTVNIHSSGAQGSAIANQANVECLHRRRIPANARGLCFTTLQGNAPGGWVATCNSNFNMDGDFQPNRTRQTTKRYQITNYSDVESDVEITHVLEESRSDSEGEELLTVENEENCLSPSDFIISTRQFSSEDNEPLSQIQSRFRKNNYFGKNRFRWSSAPSYTRSRTLQHNIMQEREGVKPAFWSAIKSSTSPLDIWQQFFTDEILENIVVYTNIEKI
ncbi:unnamed protein product [Arctia plantaginis]|uniref:Uncharacterized protein n=1 Tax=Arctia plantaginis TaxID=874455 RepID=A0A8S0ZJL3_ARCPL|nr:unnamed protein product [Arctia plantaginis]